MSAATIERRVVVPREEIQVGRLTSRLPLSSATTSNDVLLRLVAERDATWQAKLTPPTTICAGGRDLDRYESRLESRWCRLCEEIDHLLLGHGDGHVTSARLQIEWST